LNCIFYIIYICISENVFKLLIIMKLMALPGALQPKPIPSYLGGNKNQNPSRQNQTNMDDTQRTAVPPPMSIPGSNASQNYYFGGGHQSSNQSPAPEQAPIPMSIPNNPNQAATDKYYGVGGGSSGPAQTPKSSFDNSLPSLNQSFSPSPYTLINTGTLTPQQKAGATQLDIWSYFRGTGTSADRPATESEQNIFAGMSGSNQFVKGGKYFFTPSGAGTSMGNAQPITIGGAVENAINLNLLNQNLRSQKISYDITQSNIKSYNSDVSNYYSGLLSAAEGEKNLLIADTTLTPEQKTNIYSDYVGSLNKGLQEYSAGRSDFYNTKSTNEFNTQISSDLGLKGLGQQYSNIAGYGSSVGVNVGQSAISGTPMFTGNAAPSIFSQEGINTYISKPAVNTFLPVAGLLSSDRTITVTDISSIGKTGNVYSNVPNKEDLFAIGGTVLTGFAGATGTYNALARESAGVKAMDLFKNPTEEFVTSASTKGYFGIPEATLFNPSKEFSFKVGAKEATYLNTKLALQNELALNPTFGKEFTVKGGGYVMQDFTALPSDVSGKITHLGFKPSKTEIFYAQAEPKYNMVTDNQYLKDFVKSQGKNTRSIVGGSFQIGDVEKQMAFIVNPKTGGLSISEFNAKGINDMGLMEGTRNTFKLTKSTGMPVMEFNVAGNVNKIGLYQEGPIFKNIGEFRVLAKQTSFTEKEFGGSIFSQSEMKGISSKLGRTSGTFTKGDIYSLPGEYLPRITKIESSGKYTEFTMKDITSLKKGQVEGYGVGRTIFSSTGVEKNFPLAFSKSSIGKGFNIGIEDLGSNIPKTFKGPMGISVTDIRPMSESSYPKIVGGQGDLYSQFKSGSGYGNFGSFKVNVPLSDFNQGPLSMSGFSSRELGYSSIRGPQFRGGLQSDSFSIPKSGFNTQKFSTNNYKSNFKFSSPSMAGLSSPSLSANAQFPMTKTNLGFASGSSSTQSFATAQSFSFKQELGTAQAFKTTTFSQQPFKGMTPNNFPGLKPDFGGGFDFRLPSGSLDLGLGGTKTRKGKRPKNFLGPSLTAEVFDIRGSLPKAGKYGINPFQIRKISKKAKGIFDIGI
jgi:hypothetical protein